MNINECMGFCRQYFNEIASANDCKEYCNEFISSKNLRDETKVLDTSYLSLPVVLCMLAGPIALGIINYTCPERFRKVVVIDKCTRLAITATIGSVVFAAAYISNAYFC